MHRTDVFIVNVADLEYTKVNDAVFKYIYIIKRTEIKVRNKINHENKKVGRLSDKNNLWKECIQIIIHV